MTLCLEGQFRRGFGLWRLVGAASNKNPCLVRQVVAGGLADTRLLAALEALHPDRPAAAVEAVARRCAELLAQMSPLEDDLRMLAQWQPNEQEYWQDLLQHYTQVGRKPMQNL